MPHSPQAGRGPHSTPPLRNRERAISRLLLATVLLGCSALACGLRELPLVPDGGFGSGVGAMGGPGTGSIGSAGVGGTIFPDGGLDALACSAGSACIPADPCHVGQTVCSANGNASCVTQQPAQANGTVCGRDMVCSNGACVACVAGAACPVTEKPCRTGAISCATGAPVCAESGDTANGVACGSGLVCRAGECEACHDGDPCVPSNACHQGALDCSTGTPVCNDKGTPVAPGTTCGADKVCNAQSACVDCKVGTTCVVSGKPCRTAAVACDSGAPVCTEADNVANGMSCGTNMVCSNGTCVVCTAGLACTAPNPCHAGVTVCSPSISCSDTGRNLANGSACGMNKVCSSGNCVPCTSGAGCQPSNACRTGVTSCVTGTSLCAETGNASNGSACGSNKVCNGGSCNACTANATCQPSNPCKTGKTTCSSGTSQCTESGNAPAGAACGGQPSCVDGVLTPAPACDGKGNCVPGAPVQCSSPPRCADATSCRA